MQVQHQVTSVRKCRRVWPPLALLKSPLASALQVHRRQDDHGASAIIAASQDRRPAVGAVTTTTRFHRPNNNKKFRSKNARALSNSAPAAKGAAWSE